MPSIKEKVALTSILASGGLTLAKGLIGFATGSLAILSEAAHSLLDLAANPGQYLRAREGECELGTLAIGKRCQERISATGWAW